LKRSLSRRYQKSLIEGRTDLGWEARVGFEPELSR
jgi:hypothetical protein